MAVLPGGATMGTTSPCLQVTIPHRRCQPALWQLLWPKSMRSNGTPALPPGGDFQSSLLSFALPAGSRGAGVLQDTLLAGCC